MAQLLLRDIEEDLVARLRERAARHGRSAEAEHREILRAALLSPGVPADFWAAAEQLRAATATRPQTPVEILLREDRDSR